MLLDFYSALIQRLKLAFHRLLAVPSLPFPSSGTLAVCVLNFVFPSVKWL